MCLYIRHSSALHHIISLLNDSHTYYSGHQTTTVIVNNNDRAISADTDNKHSAFRPQSCGRDEGAHCARTAVIYDWWYRRNCALRSSRINIAIIYYIL